MYTLVNANARSQGTPNTFLAFYLNQTSIELLQSLPKSEDYIFKPESGQQLDTDAIRRALLKIAQAAGLQCLTRVHDLRHTFNSLMQMSGVDPATMGRILGHKDIETTMIYTHQTQEHLKRSIEKIGI